MGGTHSIDRQLLGIIVEVAGDIAEIGKESNLQQYNNIRAPYK